MGTLLAVVVLSSRWPGKEIYGPSGNPRRRAIEMEETVRVGITLAMIALIMFGVGLFFILFR